VTLGPPRFATTHANIDLLLGLCIMATAEKDTERESTDSAEDFEKKDHQYASSG
jgi:hypothetical protein